MALDRVAAVFALALFATPGFTGSMVIEDFSTSPDSRWDYVSDQVMGGVSDGGAAFGSADGRDFVRLTGTVSTKNNGGFLQVRRKLDTALPQDTDGLELTVRGNGEIYFVHLRTTRTTLPWYYYQAAFRTTRDWGVVQVPLSAFKPSHAVLPKAVDPALVTSIGIVAYGRDHAADITVADVSLY